MQSPKVLITGATGFLGGHLLIHCLESTIASLKSASYRVLIRDPKQEALFSPLDISVIVLNNQDDVEELRRIASEFDIIVNCAYATYAAHSKALVLGLADHMKKGAGSPRPHIIQTSGTSNIADRPITKPNRWTELGLPHGAEFTDLESEKVYAIEKRLEQEERYIQRTTELTVIDTALEVGIPATVVMPPRIYGVGRGPGRKMSIQVPMLIKAAVKNQFVGVIGEGKASADHIHVSDLCNFYALLMARIIEGKAVPTGKEGILFATSGQHTMLQVYRSILSIGKKLGKLPADSELRYLPIKDALNAWGVQEHMHGAAELGFAGNARTKGERANREWGWTPEFVGTDDFILKGIESDWKAVLEEIESGLSAATVFERGEVDGSVRKSIE